MAINYLRNTSMQGVNSMFFSLDMGKQIVYSKLVQKETGLNFKESLDLYRYEPEKAAKIAAKLENDYKNVGFNFRAGTSVADIRRSIKEREQLIGGKVKLVVVDYLECIQSSLSDPTAGGGQIAGQLKDVANEEEVCILLLLQTQKHSTPEISDPLLSLKQVKGSSVVEQSCSSILTLWREGYSPKYVDNDRYISFAVVKNRFGGLWSGDFSWDGVRGNIESLAEEEKQELKDFRRRKKEEKAANELSSNKGWE
jgi:replicative DNA helicase